MGSPLFHGSHTGHIINPVITFIGLSNNPIRDIVAVRAITLRIIVSSLVPLQILVFLLHEVVRVTAQLLSETLDSQACTILLFPPDGCTVDRDTEPRGWQQ